MRRECPICRAKNATRKRQGMFGRLVRFAETGSMTGWWVPSSSPPGLWVETFVSLLADQLGKIRQRPVSVSAIPVPDANRRRIR
jgi:hypothetical protein